MLKLRSVGTLESPDDSTANSRAQLNRRDQNSVRAIVVVLALILCCRASFLTAQTRNSQKPTINGLNPPVGNSGITLRVLGSGFGGQQGESFVTIGGIVAQPISWSDSEVRVIVPRISAGVPVVVTRNKVSSNAISLDFLLSVRAVPQPVYITPDEGYVGVEEVREFKLVDQQGHEIFGVVWKTDDPKVADFDYVSDVANDSAPSMLMGHSPGKVTITATSQSSTAQAIAWVHAEGRMVPGVPTWSLYPHTIKDRFSDVVKSQPWNPGDPDIYVMENRGSEFSILALDRNGHEMWTRDLTGVGIGLVGNAPGEDGKTGGGVLVFGREAMTQLSGQGKIVWSNSATANDLSYWATGYDGNIYAVAGRDKDRSLKVFDGGSGSLRYQIAIPLGSFTISTGSKTEQPTCADVKPVTLQIPTKFGPVIAGDAHAYYVYSVQNAVFVSDGPCSWNPLTSEPGSYRMTEETFLIEVNANKHIRTTILATDFFAGRVFGFYEGSRQGTFRFIPMNPKEDRIPLTSVYELTPSDAAGVWVELTRQSRVASEPSYTSLIRDLDGKIQFTIAPPGGAARIALADNGSVLLDNGGDAVTVMDPDTGHALWSYRPRGTVTVHILSATDDGGLLVYEINRESTIPTTTIRHLDADGKALESVTLPGDLGSGGSPAYFFENEILVQDPYFSGIHIIPLGSTLPGTANPIP